MGEGEGRIILEEGALDSFGNLLRGMIAFWRASGGTWPRRVSLVGFGFKRARFLGLHCRVLGLGVCGGRGVGVGERDERRRWKGKGRGSGKGDENGQGVKKGVEAFFRGVDPRFMDPDALEFDAVRCQETRRGEREYGYGEWERDLWGVGERLRRKRDRRDAWGEGKGKGNVGENGDAAAGRGTRAGERQAGRALFENDEERIRSGVRTRWLEAERGMAREEVLEEGVQMPWER
ncbi:hypothetical protein DSL72_006642 [Monilinia vaccinii-corymbosi]|uniref:Uncharacterized protein n=1 Tax=Monilinia vaccinii-corymbosi TaxID=61207 RepID=A0A8A3PPB9_9HELO|nr:hypothetical protein DSL72_006642 [Monilinia vaccinii-corymbosi]